jgi:hypothetical protein
LVDAHARSIDNNRGSVAHNRKKRGVRTLLLLLLLLLCFYATQHVPVMFWGCIGAPRP